ncbi:TetR/AcrR family transcriptional regulator [Niallia circulans]
MGYEKINSTSERIIQAFIELFRDYGYKGTTTRAIAEKAGVNEVTIFRHFGNKRGLWKQLFNQYPITLC